MTSSSLKNLESALKYFNLQELCDLALIEFPEVTWEDIKNSILVHSASFSKKNVIKYLFDAVKDLSNENIEKRTSNLLLLAVGKTQKKLWIAIELSEKIPVTRRELLDQIKGAIKRTGMLADVNMIKDKDRLVLSIVKKVITKKRGIIKQTPVYFQFFLNEPYLFCTRKQIENKILEPVVESLGYSKHKYCSLSGPNVADLLTLLKNKQSGASSASQIVSPKQPTPRIKATPYGVDMSQRREREDYAKQIYGEKPPQLTSVSVELRNVKWTQVGDFDKMNGESLDGVKATFKAPNVAKFFQEMIAMGAVSDPIPEYMKSILKAGKNDLKITEH